MTFKPYLAIDIETTHLDPMEGQILSVAAVYDDGEKLEEIHAFARHERLTGSLYALAMNAKLLEDVAYKRVESMPWDQLSEVFMDWIVALPIDERITLAGKNVANFDLPWLREHGINIRAKHRVIDVGSLYLPDFGYVPSLTEINLKLGRPPVSHNALEDCRDVVAAIRHKFGTEVKNAA